MYLNGLSANRMCQETPISHIHPKDKYTVPPPLQIGQTYMQDLAPLPIFAIQVIKELLKETRFSMITTQI